MYSRVTTSWRAERVLPVYKDNNGQAVVSLQVYADRAEAFVWSVISTFLRSVVLGAYAL